MPLLEEWKQVRDDKEKQNTHTHTRHNIYCSSLADRIIAKLDQHSSWVIEQYLCMHVSILTMATVILDQHCKCMHTSGPCMHAQTAMRACDITGHAASQNQVPTMRNGFAWAMWPLCHPPCIHSFSSRAELHVHVHGGTNDPPTHILYLHSTCTCTQINHSHSTIIAFCSIDLALWSEVVSINLTYKSISM